MPSMQTLYVGVDVAKDTLTVAAWRHGTAELLGTFPNTPAGRQEVVTALHHAQRTAQAAVLQLVLEPTGGYEQPLAHLGIAQGWRVSLPNPAHVRAWAKGLGWRAKTDRQDAQVLTRFGAETQPPAWQPLPAEVSELDSLLRRKADVAQLLRQEQNRQHALAQQPQVADAVPASVARLIQVLEEELRQLEAAIEQHVQRHAHLQVQARRLRSVPGIGAKTVWPILVLLARWHRLTQGQGTAKGLVAYAGLDPTPYESGTRVRHRATISRMGDRRLRGLLVMGALGGIRGQNPLQAFYQRLVGRGKAKLLALVAAARKLLVWAWAIYRQQTAFTPERVHRGAASPALP